MAIVKVSELIGPALDWAVAKAQDWTDYPQDSIERGSKWHCDPEKTPFGRVMWKDHFKPSTDWSQGGPLIGRERIDILFRADNVFLAGMNYHSEFECYTHEEDGGTPLIAAMRCYIASKLGDEVEIPQELL